MYIGNYEDYLKQKINNKGVFYFEKDAFEELQKLYKKGKTKRI